MIVELTTAQCFEIALMVLKYCDDDWAVSRLIDDLGLTEEEARLCLEQARCKLPY